RGKTSGGTRGRRRHHALHDALLSGWRGRARREHASRGEIAQLHSRRAGIGEGGLKHYTVVERASAFGLVRSRYPIEQMAERKGTAMQGDRHLQAQRFLDV